VQETETRPPENNPRGATYSTVRISYRKGLPVAMLWAYVKMWAGLAITHDGFSGAFRVALVGLTMLLLGLILPVLIALGILFGIALLVVLMPVYLLRVSLALGPPFVMRPIWRAGWRLTKQWLATSRLSVLTREELYRGSRVALSVFRFTFRANELLLRYVVDNCSTPDLVYCHDLYSLQAGVMLKRRCGAKLVYDSHEYYPYQYQFGIYSSLIRRYEACLVRAVDTYITVSPQLAEELGRVYRVGPVHCVPNVEPRPVPRPELVASTMCELANGRVRLLYQGNFAAGRGLEEIVRDWKKVDESKIALFLRGPKNVWRDQLEALAYELGLLGKSVHVLPPVLEKDLIGAAQEADIGLVPYKGDWLSYRFACPNKLSQYIHAGLAILGNKTAYVEQLITEGNVGLCYDVREPGSFVHAVSLLTQDRSVLDRFKENALTFSENEYHWGRYEALLMKLIG